MIVGNTRTMILLICVWLIGIAVAFSVIPNDYLFTNICVLWPQETEFGDLPNLFPSCMPVNIYWEYYSILMKFVVFAVTFTINILLYIRIIRTLHQRSSMLMNSGQDSNSAIEMQSQNASFQLEAENIRNQVARTLIANGIIFFITQTPYTLSALENVLDKSSHGFLDNEQLGRLIIISYGCLFLNSIINPYLYFGSCRYYRNVLRRTFKCK